MLIKTINLNLKILENYIAATACLLGFGLFVTSLSFIGIILLLILVIVIVVVTVKGYIKLFCSSVYQEEAALYRTLPISNTVSIWGKTLACVLWNMLLSMVAIVGIVLIVAVNGWDFPGFVESFSTDLISKGMTPLEAGIYVGSLPLIIITTTCSACFVIMTIQTIAGRLGKENRKGYMVILAMFLNGLLANGANKLIDMGVDHGMNYFFAQIGLQVFYVVLIALMYRYCNKNMDQGFDLV